MGLAALEQYRDHRQLTGGVGMHQMRLHRVAPAVDGMLAGRMEMHLLERERCAVDTQYVALRVGEFQGMAVVHQLASERAVVRLQREQLGRQRGVEIDR